MDGFRIHPQSAVWLFGKDWPGKTCGAKTRQGTPCRKPALTGKHRCQLHGGRAGAPTGERNGNYRNGDYTQEAKRRGKEEHAELRWLIKKGRELGLFG